MLRITDRAIAHLEQVRKERGHGFDAGVRFVRNGTGVGLTFASQPEASDRVVPDPRLAVYLAPSVIDVFQNAVIDAKIDEGRTSLVLRPQRPASRASERPPIQARTD